MQGVVYAKGTLDSTDYTISSGGSVKLLNGFYSGDATSLYQAGYTAGAASKANGSITYVHHQHSTTSSSQTYTDSKADASGATSVASTSSTKGGCYTVGIATNCIRILDQETITEENGDTYVNSHWKCTYCGQSGYTGNGSTPYSSHNHVTSYGIGCGYSNGQIISATITY